MNTIRSSRDPTQSSVQLCQVGLNNTASYTSLINSYGSVFVNQYIASLSSGRKRRAASVSLTCTQLNSLSGSLNQLSTSQLASISLDEFISCQNLLGLASNSWSSSQLSTLAALAKSVCSACFFF
jgi:hypothetical protein